MDVSKRNDDPSSSSSVRGFVRVLCADGGRYDADACFGGVTIYDREGFEATNGYPNGFWGWGGEDNAQFLRCARAGLALERVRGCPFDDLEGVETVTEKLARLDAAGARCASKEKKRLLRENARAWENDGLKSVAYDATTGATGADVETKANDSDEPSLRLNRFAFRLRAAIKDEVYVHRGRGSVEAKRPSDHMNRVRDKGRTVDVHCEGLAVELEERDVHVPL